MNSGNKVSLDIYKSVVKSFPYGLIIIDKDKNIIMSNSKVISLNEEELMYYTTHRTPEEIGLYALDKETLCKSHELPLDLAFNGEIVKNQKYYIKNIFVPKGLFIKINAFPMMENGKVLGATLIYEDITEEQEMYDSMIKSFSELQNHLRTLIEKDEQEHPCD